MNQAVLDESQLLSRIGGCLSILGALAVFIIYFLFPNTRSPANHLFLFISLSDLLNAIAFVVAEAPLQYPEGAGCQISAFLIQAFCVSSVLWSGIMALNLLISIHATKATNAIVQYEFYYHLFVWPLAIIPAILMILIHPGGQWIYGASSSAWCTIKDEFALLRLLSFYVPMCVVFFFVIGSYFSVGLMMARTLRMNRNMEAGEVGIGKSVFRSLHLQRYFRASSVYVLAVFLAWAPALANRLYQSITNNSSYGLVLTRAFTASGAGFLNFIAFLIVLLDRWGGGCYMLREKANQNAAELSEAWKHGDEDSKHEEP